MICVIHVRFDFYWFNVRNILFFFHAYYFVLKNKFLVKWLTNSLLSWKLTNFCSCPAISDCYAVLRWLQETCWQQNAFDYWRFLVFDNPNQNSKFHSPQQVFTFCTVPLLVSMIRNVWIKNLNLCWIEIDIFNDFKQRWIGSEKQQLFHRQILIYLCSEVFMILCNCIEEWFWHWSHPYVHYKTIYSMAMFQGEGSNVQVQHWTF
jgi:hypothetical protein